MLETMDGYIKRNFELRYPSIARSMVSCEEDGVYDYIIKTDDGCMYIYDCLDESIKKIVDDPRRMTEEDFRRETGRRIKRMMRRRQLTESELSDATGISQVMLSRYITGKSSPSFYNISKIATALNCDICEFKFY